ncbi:hypothetical protein J1N35_002076 [Gossypium stocksii]|uniref:Uncharacterized protein n=1 Tax=Gossypium stocksii TaxID=47602 RepID=A0A9D4AMZ7_9ROSI|nr:hypothetical protein J1N35_002076 [Gossypium stocksii]
MKCSLLMRPSRVIIESVPENVLNVFGVTSDSVEPMPVSQKWNSNVSWCKTLLTILTLDLLSQRRDMAKQLASIAASLRSLAPSSQEGDATICRNKAKMRPDLKDAFPFAHRLSQVKLSILIRVDPKEWLASTQDFFKFYHTEDHHRITMGSFQMEGTVKYEYH